MKKLIIVVATLCAVFSGCKSIPSADVIETRSAIIGVTAGMVVNRVEMSENTKCIVVKTVRDLGDVTGLFENQTVGSICASITRNEVNQMMRNGDLSDAEALVAIDVSNTIAAYMDYIVEKKFTNIRQYPELITSAINGFCDGFLRVCAPSVNSLASGSQHNEWDEDAYQYVTNKLMK